MMGRPPDFLHIGPGKSGSTWLHEVLLLHPEVYLTPAKDLYYFSRFYDRGDSWYASRFRDAPSRAKVVGEVCPDYLMSPLAPERIRATLGADVRLMVSLRDPVDRAYSSYLYARKHGLAAPTFAETLEQVPAMLAEGRYGRLLGRYLAHFPAAQIHVSTFDQLVADPQGYLDDVTDWLGVGRFPLDAELAAPRLPASSARLVPVAALAQRGAEWVRRHDGDELVGRVKRSSLVQRMLYRPLGDDRPSPSPAEQALVRDALAGELDLVESVFGVPLAAMWGWR